VDEDAVRFRGTPQGTVVFIYDDFPGQGWAQPRRDAARDWIQENLVDVRTPIADFDPQHPFVRDGDPARPWVFWEGDLVVLRLQVLVEITVYLDRPEFEWRKLNPDDDPLPTYAQPSRVWGRARVLQPAVEMVP
jgi:hypothetical protein